MGKHLHQAAQRVIHRSRSLSLLEAPGGTQGGGLVEGHHPHPLGAVLRAATAADWLPTLTTTITTTTAVAAAVE